MNYIEVESYEELSRKAAAIIAAQVISKPESVLGLATGSSPLGTYACLVKAYENKDLDFSRVTSVNLDEYVGLAGDNDQSYRYFMDTNLFSKINIRKECTFVPNGCAENIDAECGEYDALIEKLGGIDIQLLGIGLDGHIGFNEPDEAFIKETHLVKLDPSTIEANARFFESEDDVPREAVTMGIGSIMNAKKVLLIANGKNKEEIIKKAFFGPITPKIPASILQLHPDLTVIYSKN
ncbi:MAG: glucosamine-6-phosphate deaminase [Clostridia bacterium]|nr:glucosamine-6-phosphate deaminase [Clostridia bacterium]